MSSPYLLTGLIFVLIFFGLMLFFATTGRARSRRGLREIPAFSRLRRGVGLAVESGRRLHISLGHGGVSGIRGASALVGLSVLIGVISQSSRMTVLWSQLVYLPSMMLGGLMISYNLLPESVQRVSRVLPATQAMNAFNGLAMGGTADFSAWGSIATLIIGGVTAFLLALFLFSWDSRNTSRRAHPLLGLAAIIPYLIQALFTS